MSTLLLYSHKNDPITKTLWQNRNALSFNFERLSLRDILQKVTIFDQIETNETKLSWTLPSGKVITNKNTKLINRVLEVSENLFDDFCEEDRSYARAEFNAYLLYALESFCVISSKPSSEGCVKHRISLTKQWKIAHQLSLKTPKFYLGDMDDCPICDDGVYSDPFNLFAWRVNSHDIDKNDYSFCFERPRGTPMILSKLYHDFFSYSLSPHNKIQLESAIVENLIIKIKKIIQSDLFEALIFVDNHDITFGMVIGTPLATSKQHWFAKALVSNFNRYWEQYD